MVMYMMGVGPAVFGTPPHSTHAHSAKADVATASRQQSMATKMYGQRILI